MQQPPPEAAAGKPATGNPVHAVASDKALQIQEWEDKPTGIGEPLVEIDSTLMEPLKPMPSVDSLPEGPPPAGSAPQMPAMAAAPPAAMLAPTQQPQAGFEHVGTPPPLAPPPLTPHVPPPLMNPGFTGPMPHATGPQQVYPAGGAPAQGYAQQAPQQVQMMGFPRMVSEAGGGMFGDGDQADLVDVEKQRRKRVLVIAVGSAIAAVALVVVIIMATGGKKTKANMHVMGSGSSTGSNLVVKPTVETGSGSSSGAGSAEVAVGSGAGSAEVAPTPVPPTPPAAGTCKVEVTTNPPGAQVAIDKDTLGDTPGTFDLPCDTEAKLKIYKSKYFGVIKAVTPTSEGVKVDLTLQSAIFAVKVTSVPAGATITVGGKPMGVTPTSIRLPAFSASTIVISKDGFMPDTQKVTPKQNGIAHHVTLKKLSVQRPKK
jgi:hypothetical protein